MLKSFTEPRSLQELISAINTLFDDVQSRKRQLESVSVLREVPAKPDSKKSEPAPSLTASKIPTIYIGDIYKLLARACYEHVLQATPEGLTVPASVEKELTKAGMFVDKHDLAKGFFGLTKTGKKFRLFFWISGPGGY